MPVLGGASTSSVDFNLPAVVGGRRGLQHASGGLAIDLLGPRAQLKPFAAQRDRHGLRLGIEGCR